MGILVVGLSHRTAPVSLLERTVLTAAAAGKLAEDVAGSDAVDEAVVVSTCNRVEVVADVEKFHAGVAEVSELLARHGGLSLEELTRHLYVHYEDRAVQHVFAVACGLDSMVVGEGQILGQVRAALRTAQQAGTAGRILNELFQQALRVGKRAHADTAIDSAAQSLVGVGLDLAAATLGPLTDRCVLLVGAGSMSALAGATLHRAGVRRLMVANRTAANAAKLAAGVDGVAVPMAQLGTVLSDVDLVVSCTGATGVVIPAELVEAARTRRADPQVFLDLALPRDIATEVRDIDGCVLVDLERLAAALPDSSQVTDVEAVRAIVAEEVTAFTHWQHAAAVGPTVSALRAMAAEVVDGELRRLAGRLPSLDGHASQEIARSMNRVVDKLLHAPTVRVKQLSATGSSSYAAALRELFDLNPATVDAVTRADLPEGSS